MIIFGKCSFYLSSLLFASGLFFFANCQQRCKGDITIIHFPRYSFFELLNIRNNIFICIHLHIILILQDDAENKEKKKKSVLKSIELPVEALTYGFSQVELNQYTEQEFKMIASKL